MSRPKTYVVIAIADGEGGTNYGAYGLFHTREAAQNYADHAIKNSRGVDCIVSEIYVPIIPKTGEN